MSADNSNLPELTLAQWDEHIQRLRKMADQAGEREMRRDATLQDAQILAEQEAEDELDDLVDRPMPRQDPGTERTS